MAKKRHDNSLTEFAGTLAGVHYYKDNPHWKTLNGRQKRFVVLWYNAQENGMTNAQIGRLASGEPDLPPHIASGRVTHMLRSPRVRKVMAHVNDTMANDISNLACTLMNQDAEAMQFDPRDAVDPITGAFLPLHKMPKHVARMIKKSKCTRGKGGREVWEYEFRSGDDARKRLAAHAGYANEKTVNVKGEMKNEVSVNPGGERPPARHGHTRRSSGWLITLSSWTLGASASKKNNEDRIVKHFHEEMGRLLELLIAGQLPGGKRNLLITIPPRFGKTGMVSEEFPAYCLGHLPDCEFILTSYGKPLARKNAARCKQIMNTEWYRKMFPVTEIVSKRGSDGADDHYTTTAGGCVYATGAGGPIIGFGAGKLRDGFGGAFIIDDPVKAREARSSVVRENTIHWYLEDAKTRRNSDHTPMIIIAQRLHPDDLAGYVLTNEPDEWHHYSIPALQDDDTAAWEERKGTADLLAMRDVDPFTFYTQYQQQPISPGGQVLKEKWWKTYDDLAEVMRKLSRGHHNRGHGVQERAGERLLRVPGVGL